jgi:hypothetical protein
LIDEYSEDPVIFKVQPFALSDQPVVLDPSSYYVVNSFCEGKDCSIGVRVVKSLLVVYSIPNVENEEGYIIKRERTRIRVILLRADVYILYCSSSIATSYARNIMIEIEDYENIILIYSNDLRILFMSLYASAVSNLPKIRFLRHLRYIHIIGYEMRNFYCCKGKLQSLIRKVRVIR